ncbi:MAG: methyltransferase domain-containing protein [Magnetospirillum sp. WYHS-4]
MIPGARKQRIARSFGQAAATYDAAAHLQRHAAEHLAAMAIKLPLRENYRVLEVGAGTGILTRLLIDHLPAGCSWVVTDIAEGMLDRCRQTLAGRPGLEFRVMDGEAPDVDGPFDLIVSNLAVQWFDDLGAGLARLSERLAAGGYLAVSTLAEDSAVEWRRAHADLGIDCGVPRLPGADRIAMAWPDNGNLKFTEERLIRSYPNALAFLEALRETGAQVPAPGYRPLPAGTLRRLLRHLDAQGELALTYHIAYGVFTRTA